MSDILEKQLREERESPAGLALAPFGFHPVHQGGGLINFEGTHPDGRRVCVIEDIEGGGYGPRTLDQPVIEYDLATDTERAFPSLSAYLLALAPKGSRTFTGILEVQNMDYPVALAVAVTASSSQEAVSKLATLQGDRERVASLFPALDWTNPDTEIVSSHILPDTLPAI